MGVKIYDGVKMAPYGKEKIIRAVAIFLNGVALVFLCWLVADEIVDGGGAASAFGSSLAVFVFVNILAQALSLAAFFDKGGGVWAGMNVKKNAAVLLNLAALCWVLIFSGKMMVFFDDYSTDRLAGTVLFSVIPIFTLWALYRVPGDSWITRETVKKPPVIVGVGIAAALMYFVVLGQVETAESYSSRGWERYLKGNYKLAVEDCSKMIELAPDNARAYRVRGLAFEKLGDHNKAIEDFSKAIELNPKDAEAYRGRGLAYERLGDSKRAAEDYDMVNKMPPPKPAH